MAGDAVSSDLNAKQVTTTDASNSFVDDVIAAIDEARPRDSNLSSALRLYVLDAALNGRFTR